MDDGTRKERILKGISGSPGICIGKAYLVDREGVAVVEKYFIAQDTVQSEKNRFKVAVKKAEDELSKIIDETPEDFRHDILDTHVVLLKDKMLYGRTIETIESERVNAEWALKTVVGKIKAMFQTLADPYLRERATDIVQVSERIMQNLVGTEGVKIGSIDKRVILVAHDLSPAETSQIQLERIKGFVTDRGSRTSHTSIIARTLGIPAVVGLEAVTLEVENDTIIIVDGTEGMVIVDPDEKTLIAYGERQVRYEQYRAVLNRTSHLEARTTDDVVVPVLGNIELPEEVFSVIEHGGEGVGLYRTEFQYMNRQDMPGEEELFDKYRDVIEVMENKPVTIRTLDINGDKNFAYACDPTEPNPALGMRAIRYCLKRTDIFKTQLRAILRAAAFGKAQILVPMISCFEEVLETKKILREVIQELDKEKARFNPDVAFGIMVEVPSVVIMSDVIAEEVDFFSIGTNDLIQYALAIDRDNREVAHLYSAMHPAVIRMLKRVADVSAQKGVDLFMCGEMAGDPVSLPILLGLGLNGLSMNPQSIPEIKSLLRLISAVDARQFVADVLKERTAAGVSNLLREAYGDALGQRYFKN